MLRRLAASLLILTLPGCTSDLSPDVSRQPLGAFRLQHLVVVVDEPTQGPLSRKASDTELREAVTAAMERRFRRFEGTQDYSIGIKVAGYVLAQPGVPVLFAPRSILFLNVNVYDDVPQRLNAEPRQLTVFEDAGGDTVLGSGYTQSGPEQLAELAENAAIEIEKWLRENPEWFRPKPAAPPES